MRSTRGRALRGLCGLAVLAQIFVMSSRARAAEDAEAAPEPAASASASAPLPSPEFAKVTVQGSGAFGGAVEMTTLVYQPPGAAPFPVVIFLHGRSGDPKVRRALARPAPNGQLRYWLGRGFAVVAPIRPGYGDTGGPDVESNHAHWDANGNCTGRRPDFAPVAAAGRRAVEGTLDWLRTQAWADAQRILFVGQSVGGLVSAASGASNPPGVIGYVNFAGGAGGNPELAPGRDCDPEQLTALYAGFGRTTRVPNLWIYAQNDQYWGPENPKAWHAAFAAGGSPTRFVHAPPVADGDGHGLSRHASALWAPYLDDFLKALPAGGR